MHKPLIKKALRYARNLLIFFFSSTILAVWVYRFVPVYVTPLMVIRSVQQIMSGDKEVCRNARCTSFFVHRYTNRFIIFKLRYFEDFFDLCVSST